MAAPTIEDLPYFIQQSSRLYDKYIDLKAQLRQPQDEFDRAEIWGKIEENSQEIDTLFIKYRTLYNLPRELLTPFESAITDMVIKFSKMQALSMGLD